MKLLTAVVLFACVSFVAADYYENQFVLWMHKYHKSYSHDEFQARFQIFKTNLQWIDSFDGSFEVGLNEFADLTNQEFVGLYTGFRSSKTYNPVADDQENAGTSPPATQDWRNSGAVTSIKNQGQCGSCWSFSTTGSVEGAWKLAGHTLVGLSEQNLMDCSYKFGNMGCSGGEMDDAFKYIIANQGIDTESSYPYTGQDGTCHYSASNKGATISAYTDVTSGSETDLESAAGLIGPVSVAIDASHMSFQFYTSGVYYEPNCSSTELDHGVLVVGYNATPAPNSQQYWIVKNSWGVTWGQQGYIWMSKNRNNNCGIATDASYPKI